MRQQPLLLCLDMHLIINWQLRRPTHMLEQFQTRHALTSYKPPAPMKVRMIVQSQDTAPYLALVMRAEAVVSTTDLEKREWHTRSAGAIGHAKEAHVCSQRCPHLNHTLLRNRSNVHGCPGIDRDCNIVGATVAMMWS